MSSWSSLSDDLEPGKQKELMQRVIAQFPDWSKLDVDELIAGVIKIITALLHTKEFSSDEINAMMGTIKKSEKQLYRSFKDVFDNRELTEDARLYHVERIYYDIKSGIKEFHSEK